MYPSGEFVVDIYKNLVIGKTNNIQCYFMIITDFNAISVYLVTRIFFF